MNTYIWCAVGLIAGAIFAVVGPGGDKIRHIETVTMGIFGAVVGGDLVASLLSKGASDAGAFQASSLALAVGGAVTMLGLLTVMRRSVGPMRQSKQRNHR